MTDVATWQAAGGRSIVGLAERAGPISILWAVGAVLAVLYGSLLPFSIDFARLTPATGFGLLEIGLHRASLEDLLTNIVVYLPLGAFVVLACRPPEPRASARAAASARARRGPVHATPVRVLLATAVGGLVSVFAESLQSAMPMRVACWSDVVLNTCGALIGAAAAPAAAMLVREILRRCSDGVSARPMGALAGIFALGLFLHQLAPFDFVRTTAQLHDSFRQAKWSLAVPRTVDPAAPFALLYGKAVAAAWFVALGYLLAGSRRESGATPIRSALSSVQEGGLLVVVIELLHLFVRSNVFDTADIAVRIAAVVMGAWIAVFLFGRTAPHGPSIRQSRPVLSPVDRTSGTAVMVVWALGHALAILIEPLIGHRSAAIKSHGIIWPFEQMWRAPMLDAGWHIGRALVVYGILALGILTILRRGRVAPAEPLTIVMVALIALDAALLASPANLRAVDLTSAILATIAAMLVVAFVRRERHLLHFPIRATPTQRTSLAD